VAAALASGGPRCRLVLVVGPSGVGKDTLIDGARAVLADNPSVVFARREITRPSEAGGEAHTPVDVEAFRARAAAGDYLLCWEAHGLGYGLPAVLAAELAAGRTVVANVSRTVLDEARSRFPGVRIVSVTAEPEVVAARLARRSREDVEAVARRLARADIHAVAGEDVVVLPNNGDPREGVTALVAAIKG